RRGQNSRFAKRSFAVNFVKAQPSRRGQRQDLSKTHILLVKARAELREASDKNNHSRTVLIQEPVFFLV
ncbi:hypothetical protein, partial [Zobellella endophytica]|uniref:hypothetical protein n=1 Tax=Zobellella endophytica TaxID=2116700 RepID=UPI001B30AF2D